MGTTTYVWRPMPDPDTDSDDTDRKRVTMALPKAKVDRWDEYWQADVEYDSRTDFIRHAVAHEMADDDGGGASGADSVDMARMLAKTVDGIDDLSDRLESIEARLQSLEAESRRDPELEELANTVYSHLPRVRRDEEREQWKKRLATGEASGGERGTVPTLANTLDVPERRIRDALEKLVESHVVHSDTVEGEKRYYRGE